MFQNEPNQTQNYSNTSFNSNENNRRLSFIQNNKVLVGGDHERTVNHQQKVVKTDAEDKVEPLKPPPMMPDALTAPPIKPLLNPFQAGQPKTYEPNIPNKFPETNQNNYPSYNEKAEVDYDNIEEAMRLLDETDEETFINDVPSRFDNNHRDIVRNPSPPKEEFVEDEWENEPEYSNPPMNFMVHQANPPRFQRPWNPVMRTNVRPHGFMNQFWPRNRPPPNRPWMGHRPRFW